MRRRGETEERKGQEERDEEDEAKGEAEGYVTAEEWDSGGEDDDDLARLEANLAALSTEAARLRSKKVRFADDGKSGGKDSGGASKATVRGPGGESPQAYRRRRQETPWRSKERRGRAPSTSTLRSSPGTVTQ